jgi:hypothetical protein
MAAATEQKHNVSLFYVDKVEGEDSKGVDDGNMDQIIKDRKSFILEGIVFVNEDPSKKLTAKVMLEPVTSSNISHIGYQIANANNGYLYVLFSNGGLYIYYNVPWTTALEFNDSDSVGKYLAAHIKKGKAFACDKIL